jgi:phosphatidylinositol alpha-1,6-mannosyltransferase
MRRACSVLALVTDGFGGYGGIAQYNTDFLSALIECDSVTSIFVHPRLARSGRALPAGIVQLPPLYARIPYAVRVWWSLLRRRPDVVFCGHIYMAPLALTVALLTGARLIFQVHGVEAWRRPAGLQRMAVERASAVLSVSRYTRARVLDWADIAPERVIVVPNTVGDAFVPGDGSALHSKLGLAGKRVLLTVARMDPGQRYKGHDRILDLIPEIIAQGHDVAYLVVGEGNDRARLEARAEEKGIADRVRFLGGIDGETLVQAYRMADLYVMPSTGEGFGIAYLEAMASGLPAIGLAVAGAPDALADGDLGTVVTETELGPAIARLLSAPRPDAEALSVRTRGRFGRGVFTDCVDKALGRALDAA